MGLNITVMSYCGHLDFGIVADREQMPDVWSLIGGLGDALEELRPAGTSTSEPSKAPPSVAADHPATPHERSNTAKMPTDD